MSTPEYEQASRLNLDLETRWASLFAHLARETGEAVESIVLSLNEAGREVLRRYDQDRLQSPGAQYSELHFLDFTQFVELASKRRAALDCLGAPPPDWIARLNRQNGPLVRYRNALHHVGRFAFLPIAQQKEAIAGLEEQLGWLTEWFPGIPLVRARPVVEETGVRAALRVLDHDEKSALPLAKELGLDVVREPVNLIPAGVAGALGERLGGVVPRLYRVGRRQFGNQSVGLYLAYLDEWPERSAARDRYRRRLAAALTDHGQDARFLVVMLDGGRDRPQAERERGRYEVEVVYPRLQGGAVATVRAVIDVTSPTRYHVDLIEDLAIGGCKSVVDVQRRWNEAFSVEQVTRTFFAEIRDLRDAMARALLEANPDHPELAGYSLEDLTAAWGKATARQRAFQARLNAFATRQVCRLLFLWFLQEKGWLGSPMARGSATFLFDLFRHRPAGEATYFSDVLVPLFFDGMGSPTSTGVHRDFQNAISGLLAKVLREGAADVPYLNGGLFRADADPFEARMFGVADDGTRPRTVKLPDALFDPLKDKPGKGQAKKGQPRERTVLGLLGRYRFTTQESTPDDQSVDPDPELLGRVFEDLYQADERHETGAYYTPREVVRYMCRRALDGFLRDRTRLPQETLDALRAEAVDWKSTSVDLSHKQQQTLERALDEVTVVDPAVGSGAFLVGMLQEIVLLRRGVHAASTNSDIARTGDAVYKWKRHAITYGLFGVDINPTAVEICRLRLWLSLVIDYDPADLTRIPALPNLEFRIVAGDSLVDRMGAQPFPSSLPTGVTQLDFDSGVKMRQLEKHLEEFQDADDAGQTRRLPGLSAKIRDARREIALAQVEFALDGAEGKLALLRRDGPKKPSAAILNRAAAEVAQLAAFRDGLRPDAPFLKPLLWPVAFPQVFVAGGFDIVVANPPYVRQESLSDLDQEVFAAAFAEVYTGSADLYVFFFARALQILKDGGWLAFITSNKYMRAAYGQKLRAMLPARTRLAEIVDFGDLPVFDVAAYPAVVVARKEAAPDPANEPTVADLTGPIRRALAAEGRRVNLDGVRAALADLPGLVAANAPAGYGQGLLKGDGWILEEPTLVRLFERLMNEGTPLGAYVQGRMYYGIKTGLNEAFVIDQAARDALVAADPASAEVIKPWLRGRDIKRWRAEASSRYLIALQNSGDRNAQNPWADAKTEAEARRIFAKSYPAIHDRFSARETRLRGRSDRGQFWWELRACAYYHEFAHPKVVLSHFLDWAKFSFDTQGSYHNNAASFFVAPRPAFAALLNSNLGWYLLSTMGTALQNGFRQLFTQFFEVFPVPLSMDNPNMSTELSCLDRSVEVLSAGALSEPHDLEDTVEYLYGLSAKERIELGNWARTRRDFVDLDAPPPLSDD